MPFQSVSSLSRMPKRKFKLSLSKWLHLPGTFYSIDSPSAAAEITLNCDDFQFLTLPLKGRAQKIACVASVSITFRTKESLRKGISDFDPVRNETRAKK